MVSSERELEGHLMEVGNRLLSPPSSVDELLTLLDQADNCLSRVEQSPSKSMQDAVCPSMKALVANDFLRHSDMDVKVAVASCINEITRITAPDAPYDDEQMKEIFQLIVVAFERLYDTSSRSYSKRVSMLETVAKVRSCVVMLDLECDALIIEMFQHFLKAIRDNHPDNVFSSMETIMTLVLEESEDISTELLSPLLASVEKENQDILPIAKKLGEKVIENCAVKLKPYLMQAVQSLDISVNDYSKIVASICQENDNTASGKHSVAKELVPAPPAACAGEFDPTVGRSPKSVMSNGIVQTGNDDSLVDPNSPKKKLERCRRVNQSKTSDATINAELNTLDTVNVVKSETKPEQATKRRGRKPNSSMTSAEASDNSRIDSDKEAVELTDRRKSRRKEGSSPSEDPFIQKVAEPSEHERETETQLSIPASSHNEAINIPSSPPSQCLRDGDRPRRGRQGLKKKGSMDQEANPDSSSVPKGALLTDQIEDKAPPSANVVLKKESEVTSESEAKPHRRSGKKALLGNTTEKKTPAAIDDVVSKKEAVATSDAEAKPLMQSDEKGDATNTNEEESSVKQQESKRKWRRGKIVSEKDVTEELGDKKMVSSPKSAPKSSNIEESHSEETPRTKSKRKGHPGKEEAFETPHGVKNLDEKLVGSKIKVWWPEDHKFYEGVIDSFDPVKKQHKVLYVDGDKETLTLRKERWEFVGGDSGPDGGPATHPPSPDSSSEMHQKKKLKTDSASSIGQAKADASSSKRFGRASISKTKGEATKSGGKSRDGGKLGSKSKHGTPKAVGKSKDDSGSKSKGDGKKAGYKLKDDAHTPTGKSKNGTPARVTKTTQDSPKTVTKSKGKTVKRGSKSNTNGTAKGRSCSSKVQENEAKVKGKLSDSSKPQESESKSGKKRRRGVNG
ncbi:hypothetical protein HHK36_013833 [Tetracentron sinense]|uniref:Uncharacterized protein n=1 Tax=Tetracentron sinense TaxID=13715 RepID=A0A835DHQ8_TETSI|nr:hypothetical protein HHK36_013833 [Tetracentron sinense]